MFNRGELKESAKSKLSGKWGVMVCIFLIFLPIEMGINYLAEENWWVYIVGALIIGPLTLSITKISLNISTGAEEPKVAQLAYGFKYFVKAVGLFVVTTVAITFATLLLIVPGIIVALMYSQAQFILAENPEIGIFEAISRSCEMTKGYKWEIFVLELSFIGLILATIITLGIGLLWLYPYMQVTASELYLYLKNPKQEIIA